MAVVARTVGRVALATALVLGVWPAAALAGASWRQVTASGGANIDEVGLLRTGDGTLHVAWQVQTSGFSSDLRQTAISPAGGVGKTTAIASGWASLDNPALVPAPGGAIDAFFGGIHTTNFGDPNQDLNLATSGDRGNTWNVLPGDAGAPGDSAYSSPVAATAAGSGLTPFETWFATPGVFVHAGTLQTTPNHNFQDFGCCGYNSNLTSDAAGNVMLAWYSNATGHLGVWTQRVATDGSPVGGAVNMPRTSNMSVPQGGERTPLAARPGGGFYVAYATGYPAINQIRLWEVGSPTSNVLANVASAGGTPTASIAAAPDGRLWVLWVRDIGDVPHVFAERSNKSATKFGAVVDAGAPAGAASAYSLDANANASAVDAFGTFSVGTSSHAATWYARLLPGLSITASPSKLHRGRKTSVTFSVSDAGSPVKGAKVTAGGHSATTNAGGHAELELTAKHSLKASASDGGYVGATISLKIVN